MFVINSSHSFPPYFIICKNLIKGYVTKIKNKEEQINTSDATIWCIEKSAISEVTDLGNTTRLVLRIESTIQHDVLEGEFQI